MRNTKNNGTIRNEKSAKSAIKEKVEVLYQKLGSRWYAFSVIDEDVFVGNVDLEAKKTPDRNSNKKTFKIAGNS
mgnify:CR=1 FL=1